MKEVSMWEITKQTSWTSLENEFDWVQDMKNVPQDPIYHAEGDVAIHTKMVLYELEQLEEYQNLSKQQQLILWAAALLHDVEKRSTTVLEPDGSITSKGHAKKGAMTARYLLYTSIPTPFEIREQICALVRFHGLPLWILEKSNPAKALIEASLQVDTYLLALLAKADVLGRICNDKEELLYKIDLFIALCEENNCWAQARSFPTTNARFIYFQKEEGTPDFVPFDAFGSTVIMMAGLPGSGKNYWVSKYCKAWPVIDLDEIRRKHRIAPTDKSGNGTVIQMAKEMARSYLRRQQNFVWNATNITRQMREQLVSLFATYKAYIKIIYVEVPYRKLIAQNNDRNAVVPNTVIEKLATKLEVPVLSEAHEIEYIVN